MADDGFQLDGDMVFEDPNFDDDGMEDLDMTADADNEHTMYDEPGSEDPDDDDFRLDVCNDLGMNGDSEEDEDDQQVAIPDPAFTEDITGMKRKRSKMTISKNLIRHDKEDEPFNLDDATALPNKQSSRALGTFGRFNRQKGDTLPAYHKKVSHELDSDDELLMKMREKGFSDRQISDRLAKEGRVRYDVKSISTRIGRIRLAQAQNIDFLLAEGYKEWEFKDDSLLMQAYALADIEINYEIERVRAWRFRKVSEYMRRLNKDALFSEKACRERYSSLMDGSAVIPTDLDDNPDERRQAMETFRKSREAIRNQEQAEKDLKDLEERQAKEEATSRSAAKANRTARKRAQVATEQAQRAAQRSAAAQMRAERASENSNAKAQRHAQVEKQKATTAKKLDKSKRVSTSAVTVPITRTNGTASTTTTVTANGVDPRAHLSISNLTTMCADRGIETARKTKDELLEGLRDADEEFTASDLKKMCRSKNLATSGNKMLLRMRLALAAAKNCSSYNPGAAPAHDDDVMEDDE